jgi:hypothetical protein
MFQLSIDEANLPVSQSVIPSRRSLGFVKLRVIMATHKDLAHKIEALERKYGEHDEEIQVIFKAIRKLLEPPAAPKRRIGFKTEDE